MILNYWSKMKDDPRCNKSWNILAKNGRSEAKSVDCLGHVPLSDTGICAVVDRFCLNCQKTRENRAWRLGSSAKPGTWEHLAVSVPKIFVSRIVGKNSVYRQAYKLSKRHGMLEIYRTTKEITSEIWAGWSGRDQIHWLVQMQPATGGSFDFGERRVGFFFGFFREDF